MRHVVIEARVPRHAHGDGGELCGQREHLGPQVTRQGRGDTTGHGPDEWRIDDGDQGCEERTDDRRDRAAQTTLGQPEVERTVEATRARDDDMRSGDQTLGRESSLRQGVSSLDDRDEPILEQPPHLQLGRLDPLHTQIEVDPAIAQRSVVFVALRHEAEDERRRVTSRERRQWTDDESRRRIGAPDDERP